MISVLAMMILCMVPCFVQEKQSGTAEEKESPLSDLLTLDQRTTVSKKKEEIWYAPGVVSQVGAALIRMSGDSSRWEIAERLPAVQNSLGTAINRTSVRGGEPNNGISQVLVLVDGRPVLASGGNLSAYSLFCTFPYGID